MKTDYTQCTKKRIVQKLVYEKVLEDRKINKLVGLAGPNINNYLKFITIMGFKMANIYEINPMQMLLQVLDYKSSMNIKARIQLKDVYYAEENKEDTLYDLDFDCSILSVKRHIQKFIDNSIITLSLRPVGLEKTISIFIKLIGKEKPTLEWNHVINKDYKVHKISYLTKTYYCYQYKDKSNMVTIMQIKN